MILAQHLILPGGQDIQGPLKDSKNFTNLASVVNNAIPVVFSIAGILLLLYLIWGGFDFLTSMGDPKKADSARGKITNALLGFLLIFAAYWIVQIINFVFKLNYTF